MTTKLAAIFFSISDSLLLPVMFGLLIGLALSLWRLGTTAREALERARERAARGRVELALDEERLDDAEKEVRESRAPFAKTIRSLFDARRDPALVEKILANAHNRRNERTTTLRVLMKFAPAFGLMGTLIPLGPALVGLATGDLEALARNLGIAFATTVVGLVVGALAYFSATFEKRWATRDAILTTFAAERLLASLRKEEGNE